MHKSARKESRLCGKGSWRENKVSAIIVRAVDSSEKCGASGCSGDDLKQLRRTYCISEQLLDGNENRRLLFLPNFKSPEQSKAHGIKKNIERVNNKLHVKNFEIR